MCFNTFQKVPTKTILSTKLHTYTIIDNSCQFCSTFLKPAKTYIPTKDKQFAEIEGKYCSICKRIFISYRLNQEIIKLLTSNPFAKQFSLNGRYYWNKSEQLKKKQSTKVIKTVAETVNTTSKDNNSGAVKNDDFYYSLLRKDKSAVLLFTTKCDSIETYYIIVGSKSKECIEKNILHYSSPLSRALLAAWFIDKTSHKCNYKGREIRIQYPYFNRQPRKHILDKIIPSQIKLKKGGGLYSNDKEEASSIVDLLLYSPYSKTYEIISATYDSENKDYYISPSLFRHFIEEYGNPGVRISIYSSKSNSFHYNWDNLNAESLLKSWGYTVNQTDNLDPFERRKMLTELVDLKIVDVSFIVKMLDFFINSHPGNNYFHARCEWKSDRAYIEKYNVNPKRFLIQQP